MLVTHLLGQRAPAHRLHGARCHTDLELRQTRELHAIDGAADRVVVDIRVHEATQEVLVVSFFVNAVNRDFEGAQGLVITGREGIHAADDPQSPGGRSIGGSRADRRAIDVRGRIRQPLELLVVNRCVDVRPAILNLETRLVVLHARLGH